MTDFTFNPLGVIMAEANKAVDELRAVALEIKDERDRLKQINSELRTALTELLDLVETDATFENRDIEPYKYEAIVDDVKRRAHAALAKTKGAL